MTGTATAPAYLCRDEASTRERAGDLLSHDPPEHTRLAADPRVHDAPGPQAPTRDREERREPPGPHGAHRSPPSVI